MTLSSYSRSGYVGRFAPSPSGPLHFGSLIAALGSFLQARSQGGAWLVRIEDLDPPREVPGAADEILRTLERLGLTWDGEVLYQSRRHERYQAVLDRFYHQGLTYYCHCSRAQIQAAGGLYPGSCRALGLPATGNALRLHLSQPVYGFVDELHGPIQVAAALAAEDFILKRRDGLFAYNLAVVVDDADSGVTQVVRGADLIEPTVRQIALYRLLGQPEPSWLHLPLAVQKAGFKLSKQNHAPALIPGAESLQLWQALAFLGQEPPEELQGDRDLLLNWATTHWQQHKIPQPLEILWQ
ncbi:MAG: tRNA glutamyl-Q(34) synthetase GluQRS [Aeromonadaceae bacterium]